MSAVTMLMKFAVVVSIVLIRILVSLTVVSQTRVARSEPEFEVDCVEEKLGIADPID
jgi:hypothetical protein